jgi:hypothetical protein
VKRVDFGLHNARTLTEWYITVEVWCRDAGKCRPVRNSESDCDLHISLLFGRIYGTAAGSGDCWAYAAAHLFYFLFFSNIHHMALVRQCNFCRAALSSPALQVRLVISTGKLS